MSDNPYQQMPATPTAGRVNLKLASERVKTPAILLIISGVIGILSGVFGGGGTAALYLGMQEEMLQELENEPQDPAVTPEMMKLTMDVFGWGGVAIAVFGLITGVISIVGGVFMLKLRGRRIALIAGILSVVPCLQGCCLFSVPVGIYVIIVLCDSQVKPAFK